MAGNFKVFVEAVKILKQVYNKHFMVDLFRSHIVNGKVVLYTKFEGSEYDRYFIDVENGTVEIKSNY